MAVRGARRFGLRFADGLVPTVEITIPEYHGDPAQRVHVVVMKKRGLTRTHAFDRAVTWTRAHGDPR